MQAVVKKACTGCCRPWPSALILPTSPLSLLSCDGGKGLFIPTVYVLVLVFLIIVEPEQRIEILSWQVQILLVCSVSKGHLSIFTEQLTRLIKGAAMDGKEVAGKLLVVQVGWGGAYWLAQKAPSLQYLSTCGERLCGRRCAVCWVGGDRCSNLAGADIDTPCALMLKPLLGPTSRGACEHPFPDLADDPRPLLPVFMEVVLPYGAARSPGDMLAATCCTSHAVVGPASNRLQLLPASRPPLQSCDGGKFSAASTAAVASSSQRFSWQLLEAPVL